MAVASASCSSLQSVACTITCRSERDGTGRSGDVGLSRGSKLCGRMPHSSSASPFKLLSRHVRCHGPPRRLLGARGATDDSSSLADSSFCDTAQLSQRDVHLVAESPVRDTSSQTPTSSTSPPSAVAEAEVTNPQGIDSPSSSGSGNSSGSSSAITNPTSNTGDSSISRRPVAGTARPNRTPAGSRKSPGNDRPPWARILMAILGEAYSFIVYAAKVMIVYWIARTILTSEFARQITPRWFRGLGSPVIATVEAVQQRSGLQVDGSTGGSRFLPMGKKASGERVAPETSQATKISFSLPVPFSEFLYHVKKDNVQAVTVDGDQVSFVLRRAEFGRGHKGGDLLPLVKHVEGMEEEKAKAKAGEDASKQAGGIAKPSPVIVQLSTVKPTDLAMPYADLASKNVEFGAPDRMTFKLVNTVSVSTLLIVRSASGVFGIVVSLTPIVINR